LPQLSGSSDGRVAASSGGIGEAIADGSAPPAAGGTSGYVPAPVSFVTPEEDDGFQAKSGYTASSAGERAGDGGPGAGSAGWKDSGRPAAGDKVFEVSAGRRRPVVFEEDDDLDVPDFLK
jgi:cell division protein FtsZ